MCYIVPAVIALLAPLAFPVATLADTEATSASSAQRRSNSGTHTAANAAADMKARDDILDKLAIMQRAEQEVTLPNAGRMLMTEHDEGLHLFDVHAAGDEDYRELQQCDVCGSEGSCGRTTPLGDFFEVSVTSSEINDLWFVTCRYPDRDSPDCFYSPDGNAFNEFPSGGDVVDAILSCPDECCNWVYPRSEGSNLPVSDASCNGETNCRQVSQICYMQGVSTRDKTFTCPVGSVMYISGGSASASLTLGTGSVLTGLSTVCTETATGITCPDDLNNDTTALIASVTADDCSCARCNAFGTVAPGVCSGSVPSYIPSEGICASTVDQCSPPTSAPGTTTAPNKAEMLALITSMRADLAQLELGVSEL